jgi:hypothetical protein
MLDELKRLEAWALGKYRYAESNDRPTLDYWHGYYSAMKDARIAVETEIITAGLLEEPSEPF